MSALLLARKRGAIVPKLFWVSMLACHMPAWIGACASALDGEFRLLGCAGLTLTQAFFVLKLADVRWLRFGADRRTTVGLVAVVALLHAGVLERTVGHVAEAELAGEFAVLSGGLATAAALLLRAVRSPERRRAHHAARRARVATQHALSAIRQAFLPARHLLLERACLVNRAPPG
jgi:hypothetical protein